MKPSLGRTVWCITYYDGEPQCLDMLHVIAIGKDFFFNEDILNDMLCDWARGPFYFNDYGRTWFTSKTKAMKFLLANNYQATKVRECCYDVWKER